MGEGEGEGKKADRYYHIITRYGRTLFRAQAVYLQNFTFVCVCSIECIL